ncbi:hypothetical protein L211DRAFT_614505 [Terfezia boudieri ATCC MYA-4762]|uniref:Uncharacterized protein n=1 Tax=Terfezia boudieri ATCC MYA-4762 TaxID=1051890 RepID=A0A3N4LWE0_9PEZI|nr:hypothetical protein L211DRAFT_614505 [Terfezia boudieri ATCC MYA-4762]
MCIEDFGIGVNCVPAFRISVLLWDGGFMAICGIYGRMNRARHGNINSPHLPQHQRRHHRRPSPTTTNTRVSGAEHHREGLYEITRNLVLEGTLRKDRDSVTLATGEVKRGIIPVAHSGTGIVEGWSGFTRLPLTWELRCFALVFCIYSCLHYIRGDICLTTFR